MLLALFFTATAVGSTLPPLPLAPMDPLLADLSCPNTTAPQQCDAFVAALGAAVQYEARTNLLEEKEQENQERRQDGSKGSVPKARMRGVARKQQQQRTMTEPSTDVVEARGRAAEAAEAAVEMKWATFEDAMSRFAAAREGEAHERDEAAAAAEEDASEWASLAEEKAHFDRLSALAKEINTARFASLHDGTMAAAAASAWSFDPVSVDAVDEAWREKRGNVSEVWRVLAPAITLDSGGRHHELRLRRR